MYSIIRNKEGEKVAEGVSASKLPPLTKVDVVKATVDYQQGCSEKAALSMLAGTDGSKASLKSKFTGEKYTIETYDMSKTEYDEAVSCNDENKLLKKRANPCPKCESMLKDLGIQEQVRAPNKNQGSNRGTLEDQWNKTATHKKPGLKK